MKRMNGWLLVGIIGVCVFGAQLGMHYGQALWGRSDIWWTPSSMALSLNQTTENFQLFIGHQPLLERIEQGTLMMASPDGTTLPVQLDDVAVRLNNWQKTQVMKLHLAVFMAFFLGLSVMSLLVGLTSLKTTSKTPTPPATS